jgi:hypothetical protein
MVNLFTLTAAQLFMYSLLSFSMLFQFSISFFCTFSPLFHLSPSLFYPYFLFYQFMFVAPQVKCALNNGAYDTEICNTAGTAVETNTAFVNDSYCDRISLSWNTRTCTANLGLIYYCPG